MTGAADGGAAVPCPACSPAGADAGPVSAVEIVGVAQSGAQGADVGASVRGPGQARRGEEHEGREQDGAGGAVQPDQPCTAGRRTGFRRGRLLGGGPAAADPVDPEQQASDGDDPEPRGSEFAVDASGLAQAKGAVEVVDPGPQGQGTAAAVGGQVTADFRRGGIDEQCPVLGIAQSRVSEQHSGGVLRARGRAHGHRGGPAGVFDGGLHLGGERQRAGDGRDVQFPGIDDWFQLRGHCVQAAGDGGDEQEGPGEDPGVEVDPEQECPEPATV